jgi:hypothetical protein
MFGHSGGRVARYERAIALPPRPRGGGGGALRSDFDVDKIRANDHIGWHNTHANWDPLWILYHLANPV